MAWWDFRAEKRKYETLTERNSFCINKKKKKRKLCASNERTSQSNAGKTAKGVRDPCETCPHAQLSFCQKSLSFSFFCV